MTSVWIAVCVTFSLNAAVPGGTLLAKRAKTGVTKSTKKKPTKPTKGTDPAAAATPGAASGDAPPAAPPVEPPKPTTPPPKGAKPAIEALLELKKRYDDLDYDRVVDGANKFLQRNDITDDQRADAYQLLGSSLAVISDVTEAMEPFRQLLRLRPDFDMASDVAPRILTVFKKVQGEERERRDRERQIAKQKLIEDMKLLGTNPTYAEGGLPLRVEYKLVDPSSTIASIKLLFRKPTEESFSAVALQPNSDGAWEGIIPGESTASEDGFQLQYYVTTEDKNNEEFLRVGSPGEPLAAVVTAGQVPSGSFYKSPWFWVITGVGLAAAGGGAAYWIYHERSKPPPTELGDVKLP